MFNGIVHLLALEWRLSKELNARKHFWQYVNRRPSTRGRQCFCQYL